MSHIKIDLHTHSILSKDGGVTEGEYTRALATGLLDYIAITDHNTIAFALSMQKKHSNKIIVGEEIRSTQGEVLGLFLKERVSPGMSLEQTLRAIRDQHGLVCLPHPFSHNRMNIDEEVLAMVREQVDMVEDFNPRNIVHNDNANAYQLAARYNIPRIANSDSHCGGELGRTYTIISDPPTKQNLSSLLEKATYITAYTRVWHLLCPKKNTLKKMFHIQ
jgi:predicted metal-dependent phosphoesterase TrpH